MPRPESALAIFLLILKKGFAQRSATAPSSAEHRAMLDEYCVVCHNQQLKTAGLMLDKMDLDHVGDGAETWEKVILKLRGGMMPPPGNRRPRNAQIDKFLTFLEGSLERAQA